MSDPRGDRPPVAGARPPEDAGDGPGEDLAAWQPEPGVLLQDAFDAARALLDGMFRGEPCDLVLASCTEFPSAWVFGYNTREFLTGGDFLRSIVGGGPVVVPRSGAEPYLGGSGTPIGAQLGEEPCEPRSS